MYMETRNSKTEIPLFKVKDEKFIFVGENVNEICSVKGCL